MKVLGTDVDYTISDNDPVGRMRSGVERENRRTRLTILKQFHHTILYNTIQQASVDVNKHVDMF